MLTLFVVVIALAVLAVLAWRQPGEFAVERSLDICATPERLYTEIVDFHRWPAWSPWAALDPAMTTTFTGAPSGVGAAYAWEGNSKVGAGRMEILAVEPNRRIDIQLDFLKPFPGHNRTVFSMEPQGEKVTVRWRMTGPLPFIAKLMRMFMNMDAMIGKDFSKGLENLRKLTEA